MNTLAFVLLQNGGVNPLIGLLPWILIFGIFYFLLILPQRKRQKQLQEMINNLKIGDRVVTSGGLVGTITSMKDDSLMLRTGQVNVEIQRSSVASKQTEAKETKDVKGSSK